MMIAPAALRATPALLTAGVGVGRSPRVTGMPALATTSAAARAHSEERNLVSQPTTSPFSGFPSLRTYSAMAEATRRTVEKMKSSPITPRQPSVPDLIVVLIGGAFSKPRTAALDPALAG